nr:basic proline-rich protein-like [Meriones unguiculatus]XP_021511094.1 basic proline-rich protein-like [Meriones unguiculatus]
MAVNGVKGKPWVRGGDSPSPEAVANLHCSLLGVWAAQGRGREKEQRSAHPGHSLAPPASRICVVRRTTPTSRAPPGRLPSAPPPSPRGLAAAFAAADSSRSPRPEPPEKGGAVHSPGDAARRQAPWATTPEPPRAPAESRPPPSAPWTPPQFS